MGLIRRLYPSDKDAVTDHLLRLESTDRRLRFCSAMSDRAIMAHVARIDWWQGTVFGFVETESSAVSRNCSRNLGPSRTRRRRRSRWRRPGADRASAVP